MKTLDPVGIFLMESKVECGSVARIMKKLGFSHFFTVPPIGKRGGFVFCWRPGFCFKVLWQSKNLIHMEVEPGGEDPGFLFFGLWTFGVAR